MGIARGIFVVDTHVHAVRIAMKFKERGVEPTYEGVFSGMGGRAAEASYYDNSERLLYHMDRYGVDMAVIMSLGGATEVLIDILKKHPDRFVGRGSPTGLARKVRTGEAEWSIEEYCKELDEFLATGLFQGGIGEGMPGNPTQQEITWRQRYQEICQIMEVARKHKVPVSWHTPMGTLSGYAGASRSFAGYPRFEDPLLVHEIATTFPDVPIIMSHGGMQGWWSEMYLEPTLNVAAGHDNVYLETGLWWAELYQQPLRDPNIGPEKLIWGTDWGASIPQQWQPGLYPETYANQSRKGGIPAHQIDVFGWSLRQLDKLDIPQDDLNLILGGNAVRIMRLENKVPHTRLFKQYMR